MRIIFNISYFSVNKICDCNKIAIFKYQLYIKHKHIIKNLILLYNN